MVEAVLSLSFFGIVLGVSFMLCHVGWDSWLTNSARVNMAENLRRVESWMKIDLNQSGAVTLTDVPADGTWYHTITFKRADSIVDGAIVWGDTMSYALGGSDGHRLIRTKGSVSNPVSQNIVGFDVRREVASPNIVQVHVTTREKTGRSADEAYEGSLDFIILMHN